MEKDDRLEHGGIPNAKTRWNGIKIGAKKQ